MYDAENVEFKFSRLRRHLKISLNENRRSNEYMQAPIEATITRYNLSS